MPIDLREIAEAPKSALDLVEDAGRRRVLEQFMESTRAMTEMAARAALQQLVDEVNVQLAPQARVRLVQEGSQLVPEVVTLGEEKGGGWTLRLDGDEIARVLVRMPSNVKERAGEAAKRAGMSMNNWTVTVLERALANLRQRRPEGEGEDKPG